MFNTVIGEHDLKLLHYYILQHITMCSNSIKQCLIIRLHLIISFRLD